MRIESESRSNYYDLCFCAEPDAPGTFFIGIMGNMGWKLWHGARLLSADEARQLRDELTTFLGEPKCQRCAANEHLLYELPGLRDANEALRRDNDDLTRQKDRLLSGHTELRKQNDILIEDNRALEREQQRLKAEAETLAQQKDYLFADRAKIAAENEKLRQRVASLEKDAQDRFAANATLHSENTDLREENARLKVDLMNARARTTCTITVGDWSRITGS